ncbi:MAG: hypothetical protein J6W05_07420 [Prevotella sp.]|nr:hypothetical protein [Prevotella sp.]
MEVTNCDLQSRYERSETPTATQKDIEELRQRIKALEESGTATREEVKETKRELIQVYEALTQLGEKQQEPLPEIGYAAIQKRREEEDKS